MELAGQPVPIVIAMPCFLVQLNVLLWNLLFLIAVFVVVFNAFTKLLLSLLIRFFFFVFRPQAFNPQRLAHRTGAVCRVRVKPVVRCIGILFHLFSFCIFILLLLN